MKNARRNVVVGILCGLLLLPVAALADSITPDSYTASIAVGESVTIHKIVTVTEEVTSAKVDVFFLTDTTGSMGSLIDGVRNNASDIMSDSTGFGDVAFGVGEYKDWGYGDPYAYRLNTAITTDTAAVQNGINQYAASGGYDWYEANLYAIDKVATDTETGWRTDSTKIIVWFGDAPGHDPSNGVTEADATADLQAANITVEALNTGNLDGIGQATRIANATGGSYYSSIDTDAIVDAIHDAIHDVFENYSEVSLDLSGVPGGLTASVVPGSFTGTYDRSTGRSFVFDVSLTGDTAGTYNFDINAMVDGGIVASESDSINVGVPEPSAVLLIGFGLLSLIGYRRKFKG